MSETRENAPAAAAPTASETEADDQITLRLYRPAAGQVVIEVGGEVDMLTSPQLRAAVLEQYAEGAGVELVVLALDDVVFLGTSGLAVLIEVRDTAHNAGVELRLACTARRVMRPLAIAGLVPLFDIHPTVEEALVST
jgi:anti-sigma B factor antagonist